MGSFRSERTKAVFYGWLFVLFFSPFVQGQVNTSKPATASNAPSQPKIILIDDVSIRPLLIAKGKPLLINFWATWCDPCREEFPDLVMLDTEFKGKIDFITISLDDPDEIATTVPRFLAAMKAEMPAFLLKTADESAVIASISKAWQGGMPFTILYDKGGNAAYEREGKVKLDVIRPKIEALLAEQKPN